MEEKKFIWKEVFKLKWKGVLEKVKGDADEEESKQALSEKNDRSSRGREFQISGVA